MYATTIFWNISIILPAERAQLNLIDSSRVGGLIKMNILRNTNYLNTRRVDQLCCYLFRFAFSKLST